MAGRASCTRLSIATWLTATVTGGRKYDHRLVKELDDPGWSNDLASRGGIWERGRRDEPYM